MVNFQELSRFHTLCFSYYWRITTLVTTSSTDVSEWITSIEKIHKSRLHKLVIGLDVKWRPNFHTGPHRNPVATLQLCVGRNCLIFQIRHARLIPDDLRGFLFNVTYTFVGVRISYAIVKLFQDYGLRVCKAVDLASWAVVVYRVPGLQDAGLERLSWVAHNLIIHRPMEIQISAWDDLHLSMQQINYASADASLSFEIGRFLQAWTCTFMYSTEIFQP